MSGRDLIWDRLGALSGIVFVTLFIIGTSLSPDGDPPSPGAEPAVLANFLAGNGDVFGRQASLLLAATFFLICFVSYLRRHLQRHEGENDWLASAAYAGGLIAAGLFLVMGSLGVAQGVAISEGADIQVSSTLYVLTWDFIDAIGPPMGLLIGATSVAGIRYGAFPVWVSWTGVPIAVALVAGTILSITWFGFVLSLPWFVLVSSVLLVRNRKDIPAPDLRTAEGIAQII